MAYAILNRAPKLDGVEEPLLTCVRACLQKTPERRPTAGQARKLLFGRRPKPASAAARPVKQAQRPPRPVPAPPTLVERPVVPAPPPDSPKTGKAVAALIGTVAVAGVVIWAVPGLSGGSSSEREPTPPPTSAAAALSLLEQYEAFWPAVTCATYNRKAGQKARDRCEITDSIDMLCAEWSDRTTMAKPGNRPAREDTRGLEEVGGRRNSWYRQDSDLHGNFYSYPVSAKPENEWAIWWEDDKAAISCQMHGPPRSEAALLAEFQKRGFLLRDPMPARPS